MILSQQSIIKYLEENKIKVEPLQKTSIGAVSVDLHLGKEALNPDTSENIEIQDYHLSFDEFLLTNTLEQVSIPNNLVARVVPRSSIARLGVLVTFDADILPPNYEGKPILTLKNLSKKPVLLSKGLAVCQLIFQEVDKPVVGYRSRYDHSKPEPSKL
jgi:dCTP deaminase